MVYKTPGVSKEINFNEIKDVERVKWYNAGDQVPLTIVTKTETLGVPMGFTFKQLKEIETLIKAKIKPS